MPQQSSHAARNRRPVARQSHRRRGAERVESADERRLERELRLALAHNGFVLHYLPQVALASGATTGGEALLRWWHRRRGMIAPSLFLPVAERSGLGVEIGGWVLRTACVEAAGWPQPATLAVNVSPRHLASGALLTHVGEALESSGLPADRLELDIPESVLLEVGAELLLALAALRDVGVGVACDGFGAGHGSIEVLRRLPLTTIKLDRSLIRALPADPEDAAIVRALIQGGHAFGCKLVAGGIETLAQRQFLAEAGCDEAHGHLFGPPLAGRGFAARLRY
ncbi:MAG: EAL domain-containing protein [Alphaproteobacteria bacterium]|nr:EAL domain-containing protein [Alphaproteobacteria bacterium]